RIGGWRADSRGRSALFRRSWNGRRVFSLCSRCVAFSHDVSFSEICDYRANGPPARLDELPNADERNPYPVWPIVQLVCELVERLVENEGVEERTPRGTARRKLSVGEGRVV